MVKVQKRDAAIQILLIHQYIRSGSGIYSDEWRAYSSSLGSLGFTHRTVNHRANSVDPVMGAHRQIVERSEGNDEDTEDNEILTGEHVEEKEQEICQLSRMHFVT